MSSWATTKLATDAGGWRPINRAAIPMIWPIFRPDDSEEASTANITHPADDARLYREQLARFVARVVANHGSARDPSGYGYAVADRLTPDVLPYRIGTPAAFGFAGFNGRTLSDNAPEIMFSLVTNIAVPAGLVPRRAADARRDTYPYVVPVT